MTVESHDDPDNNRLIPVPSFSRGEFAAASWCSACSSGKQLTGRSFGLGTCNAHADLNGSKVDFTLGTGPTFLNPAAGTQ